MEFIPSVIPDVVLIEPKIYGDERGFFMETWNARRFGQEGLKHVFVQDNHSRSVRGTLRGLHYQIKHAQGKLVRVIIGEVFDVAVDLRRSSPNFGKWVGFTISEKNRRQLWIPPGFAHGFYVISEFAEFEYKCTDFYAPEYERTLRWDEPQLAINWPLHGRQPLLSRKDAMGLSLAQADVFD